MLLEQRGRLWWMTGVAVLAHGALLWSIARTRLREIREAVPTSPPSFDLDTSAVDWADQTLPIRREPDARLGAAQPSVAPPRSVDRPAEKAGDEAHADPFPGFERVPWAFDTRAAAHDGAPPIDLGIGPGASVRWAIQHPSVVAPEEAAPAQAPMSTTGGLKEALEASDQKLGLGPSGAVVSAAREIMHSDVAPQLGAALLVVTVLTSGEVGVNVAKVSSDFRDWSAVADNLRAHLKKKPPHIGEKRNGIVVALRVLADERWPNGSPVRRAAPRLVIVPPTLRSTEESKARLRDQNPVADDGPPPPGATSPPVAIDLDSTGGFVEHHGRLGDVQAGIGWNGRPVVRGRLDAANIGASPARRVDITVVDERVF
jgi:hypothetical protein